MCTTHFENIDTEEADRPCGESQGAAVYRLRIGSYVAECSCGWSAHRRLLKAAACQDAWAHAAQQGCAVSNPLVIPFRFLRTGDRQGDSVMTGPHAPA
jgi:hypothetical protein